MAAQGQRTAPLVPRKIISFKEQKEEATFHHDILEKELKDHNALYDQLYIISIIGVCRSGKSFLINLMIKYLDYYCQFGRDDGWEESPTAITGINWAKGKRQTVTHGVWCIVYPKLVHNIRVVLMDFQGTADKVKSTPTLDKMISFYGLKLSNLTILNLVGKFDAKDLETMSVCTLEKDGTQLHTGFEDLLFLVRDWLDEEEPETVEAVERTTFSADVKKNAKAIRTGCRTVKMKSLPLPGKNVANANETQGLRIFEIDQDFTLSCKELFRNILIAGPARSANTKPGVDFVCKFQMLGEDTVGKIQSPMDAAVSVLITGAWNDALEKLEKKVEVLKDKAYETEDEIKKVLDAALKEATKVYEADARVVKHASEERMRTDLDGLRKIIDEVIRRLTSKLKQREVEERQAKFQKAMEEETELRLQQEAEAKRLREEREKVQEQLANMEIEIEREKLRAENEKAKMEMEKTLRLQQEAEAKRLREKTGEDRKELHNLRVQREKLMSKGDEIDKDESRGKKNRSKGEQKMQKLNDSDDDAKDDLEGNISDQKAEELGFFGKVKAALVKFVRWVFRRDK